MPPFPVYGIMPKRNSLCQRKRGRFRFTDMAGEETEGERGTGGRALAAAGCVAAAALLVAAALLCLVKPRFRF